ncbi:hypothetical protein AB4Y40_25445 [Paraburkholderia sp. EG287B]
MKHMLNERSFIGAKSSQIHRGGLLLPTRPTAKIVEDLRADVD